jgi:hypothetical protein
LSVIQSLGVCLTVISIYLINQREQIATIFAPKAHELEATASKKLSKKL